MKGERPAPGRGGGATRPGRSRSRPADTRPARRAARADTMPMAVVRPTAGGRPAGSRAALAWAGVAGLGGLVLVRDRLAGRGRGGRHGGRASSCGAAVLTGPLTGWLGDLAARAQLTGYASLTGAFERYPEPVGAARELAAAGRSWSPWSRSARSADGCGSGRWPSGPASACSRRSGPAVLALGSFGPGQLGVMWLAVGGALLVSSRSGGPDARRGRGGGRRPDPADAGHRAGRGGRRGQRRPAACPGRPPRARAGWRGPRRRPGSARRPRCCWPGYRRTPTTCWMRPASCG